MSTETTDMIPADSAPQLPARILPARGIPAAPIRLSRKKARAIELFTQGKRVMDVAAAVGVSRGTIYRWQTGDPNFIAAMNEWRGRILAETRDRILEIGAKAATALDKSIDEGEARIGFRVLDKLGCLNPGPQSPVDPFKVFGLSLEDEATRGPIVEAVAKVSDLMSREQALRFPHLLALAVAIDNHWARQPTPQYILDMAGPLAKEIMRAGQAGGAGASVEVQMVGLIGNDAAATPTSSEVDLPLGRKSAAPPPTRVEARVLRYCDKGGPDFAPGRWRPG